MTPAPASPEFFDRLQAGDPAATREFVDRYTKVALTMLRVRFTRIAPAEHEDLAQEILVDVLESLEKYARSRPFQPWFITIARRRALDFLRENADEWVDGEYGQLTTLVSLDFATGPEAPDVLRSRVLTVTAGQTATDAALDDEDAQEATGMEEATPDLARDLSPNTPLGVRLTAVGYWAESRSPTERALLSHYMYGASWDEVSAELAKLGEKVSPGAARVRGLRLLKRAAKESGAERVAEKPEDRL